VPAIVFVVLGSLAIGGCLVARSATQNSERRLLQERAAEVGAVLTNSTGSVRSSMQLLGETYAGDRTDHAGFLAGARSLTRAGGTTVGIATLEPAHVAVQAEAGARTNDTTLVGPRAALIRRAAQTKNLVTAIVKDAPTSPSMLLLAIGRTDGLVVFEEAAFDPTRAIPATPDSPYRELDVVVYRSSTPNRPRTDDHRRPHALRNGRHERRQGWR
jgi:hypothetical protein